MAGDAADATRGCLTRKNKSTNMTIRNWGKKMGPLSSNLKGNLSPPQQTDENGPAFGRLVKDEGRSGEGGPRVAQQRGVTPQVNKRGERAAGPRHLRRMAKSVVSVSAARPRRNSL